MSLSFDINLYFCGEMVMIHMYVDMYRRANED